MGKAPNWGMQEIKHATPEQHPSDIGPGQTVQSPPDTSDPNALKDAGKSAFGAQAGPSFAGFPRTTRARKRNSF